MRSLGILVAVAVALPSWALISPAKAAGARESGPPEIGERWRPPPPKPPKKPPKTRGAPGPVVGVGLPMLIIAGAGAFLLVRRRRNEELKAIESRVTSQAP
jgi:hypothetical protein